MAKYRKKPVVVDAIVFDGVKGGQKYAEFFGEFKGWYIWLEELVIDTLEGIMTANKGDYIIKGVAGEFYPCKKEIFEQTYELVTD